MGLEGSEVKEKLPVGQSLRTVLIVLMIVVDCRNGDVSWHLVVIVGCVWKRIKGLYIYEKKAM